VTLNDLATFGQLQPQTDSLTLGVNTISFPGVSGIHIDLSNASAGAVPTAAQQQAVAPGVTVALIGQFQNVIGTPGDDYIKGDASVNVLDGGGSGNDTLVGGSGPATLIAGSGNDSLVAGSGGTTFVFAGSHFGSDVIDPPGNGVNKLDFTQFGGPVSLELGTTAPQTLGGGTASLTLTLQNVAEINALVDSAYSDNITGNAAGDTFYAGTGNDTFTGGGGADTFFFNGSHLGNDVINEPSSGNTLNFYGFGGPINLNLSQSGAQTLCRSAAANLGLTLTNPLAFNTVIGTPYADVIQGNGAARETIIGAGGADSLMAGSGTDYVQGAVTRVVYLQFLTAAQTPPGEHVYTASEQSAVLHGLQQDYGAFNFFFTTDPAAAQAAAQVTGGRYATLLFDAGPAGGAASELDVGSLDLAGTGFINVSPLLGDATAGLVPPTSANIIGLTTTIAAHELGHLSGLQHQDAFGPIGTGIYTGVDPTLFYPTFPGPSAATETTSDIMASPSSVGSTLLQAAGTTWVGERDAIKLAFNDSGTVLAQPNLATQSVSVTTTLPPAAGGRTLTITSAYVVGNLPSLAVPNTLRPGARDYGATFNVTAVAVNGTLATTAEEDFYAFNAHAGQLMTFQVISNNNTLNPRPIISELLVVGPSGQVVGYNRNEFESSDSTLMDITLPADGTYYVGVDSYQALTAGNYQLFMYSFATSGSSAGGGATLVGASGNDTLVGSSANDQFVFPSGSAGNATVLGGSGQDVLDLRFAPQERVTATGNITVLGPLPGPTTTALASSASSPAYGQSVTLTATVTATRGGTPTGSVDFVDQTTGQDLGTTALALVGQLDQASATVTGLAAGAHTIVALYTSNNAGAFVDSASPGLAEGVTPATPTVRAIDGGGTYSGLAFAATATVTGVSGSAASLEGLAPTLTYYAGTATSGTPLPGAPTQVGTYTVVATFTGSTDYTAASASTTFVIAPATLTVTANNASRVYGAANPSFNWTITGFVHGETVSLVSGIPSLSATATATSPAGAYPITPALGTLSAANYTFAFVNGTLTINKDATTTALAASTNLQVVTLSVTVTANAPGSGTPTGSVDFFVTTTNHDLGSVTLSGASATLRAPLPVGVQVITATYGGDGNFLTSSGRASASVLASIYVLNTSAAAALSVSGLSTINVPGSVVVDSTSATAVTASGNAQVTAASIVVVGGVSTSGNASLSPRPVTGAAPVPDPFAGLAAPSVGGSSQVVNVGDGMSRTINPGIYSQISVTGSGRLTMNPGVYVIAGGGFTATGNATVTGSGVLIYNAGSNYPSAGGNFGGITLSGNAQVNLTAAASGTWAGIVIFQSRDNTHSISLSDSAVAGLNGGLVYAPAALLYVSGNAHLSGPVVVNELSLPGS
jgi:hypothetical protein